MPEQTTHTAELADVLHRFGGRWQIEQHEILGAWTAVVRPTPTAIRIIVGRDLDELARKLEALDS